jgi:hypothetical protein
MVVTPSFSRVAGYTTGDTVQPIFDNREATTTVRVMNSQTLVIGGLRQRSEAQDARGLPWLRNIWLLGELFKGREQKVRESELVVFITPEIVTPQYAGRERELAALEVARSELDQIPIAPTMNFPIHGCRGPGFGCGVSAGRRKEWYAPGAADVPAGPPCTPAPAPAGVLPPSRADSVLAPPGGPCYHGRPAPGHTAPRGSQDDRPQRFDGSLRRLPPTSCREVPSGPVLQLSTQRASTPPDEQNAVQQ